MNIKIWQIALKIISATAVGGKKICGNFKKKFDEINNPIVNKNVPKIIDFLRLRQGKKSINCVPHSFDFRSRRQCCTQSCLGLVLLED